MNGTIWCRKCNGEEYNANADTDTFKTKRAAQQRAEYWRSYGYNARIARTKSGYFVYHSVNYAKRCQ